MNNAENIDYKIKLRIVEASTLEEFETKIDNFLEEWSDYGIIDMRYQVAYDNDKAKYTVLLVMQHKSAIQAQIMPMTETE